jgi:hypothetical protein
MGPSDDTTTIIYGNLTEVNCLFKLGNTRITYGTRKSMMYLPTLGAPSTFANELGHYIIVLDSLSVSPSVGLSLNYMDSYSQANYFIPIPTSYNGRLIQLDIQLDSSPIFGGLDCF